MASIDLFIWRHAEAEEGIPDLERRLTAKGRRDAARVAKALVAHVRDGVMISSPAARTRETAAALTEACGLASTIDTRIAPGAHLAQVLRAVHDVVDAKDRTASAVVFVGHQPWAGELAHQLLAGVSGDWRFRKAAAWWLTRRAGESAWALRTILDPDLVGG